MGEHSIGNYYRPINRPIVKSTKDFNPFDEEEALQRLRAKSRRNTLTRFFIKRKLNRAIAYKQSLSKEQTALKEETYRLSRSLDSIQYRIDFLKAVLNE